VAAVTLPEAPLEETEHGVIPAGEGWFVLNAKAARWRHNGQGGKLTFFEGTAEMWQVGVNVSVLEPGEPMAMYHHESVQEDFLVLAGEPRLIVEGEERPLRPWDFFHCPPGTSHVIVGAGDGPSVLVCLGARGTGEDWGAYTVDEAALRHGAGVDEETTDSRVAYARFPADRFKRYEEGSLPG
jgi:uncharacterized cupin superfamily protein